MEKMWKILLFSGWKIHICVKRTYRTKKRQFLVFTLTSILAWISVYWFFIRQEIFPDMKLTNDIVQRRLHNMVATEKGTGCVMPDLDPFSHEALQFSEDVGKIVCEGVDWVECYKSECQATKHIQSQMKDLVCIYRDILFLTDFKNEIGEPVKVYGGDKYQLNRSDHVKVSCTGTDVNGFNMVSSRWYGIKIGFRPIQTTRLNTDSVNIMIVMFESTSRNGFIRRMPKSYKFLVEELKAVVMKSYNIVLDGTPGALFPILTGYNEMELLDSRKFVTNRLIDDTPFIFHLLKEHSFQTLYFEDMPWIGTFQFRFNGFQHPPADHYIRPFFREDSDSILKLWTGVRRRHCVGALPHHCIMLNATAQFYDLDGSKFSFTFIAGISHENFNTISYADEDLVDYLKKYQQLNNTVLIVMGDHGTRFQPIRNTFQGKIEERLPFVSFVLPETLKRSRPEALKNLIANTEVLTTHYDMHTTLLDILNLSEHRNRYKVPGSELERGLSLLKPLVSRSCAEAGIMPHFCACTKWHDLTRDDPLYMRAAEALADFIDRTTAFERSKCASRTLSSVDWVLRQSPEPDMLGFRGRQELDRYLGRYNKADHVKPMNQYYQVNIVMNPGQSIFEGSMQHIVKDDVFVISVRDISRINAYGNESNCISHINPSLNPFCYCKDHIKQVKN